MKTPMFCIAILGGALLGGMPASANAQADDLNKRLTALGMCQEDNFLGYGDYSVCVEQVYYDLLISPPPESYFIDWSLTGTYGGCAATRIRPYCKPD